jgi:transcriptional regulator with XRE-family HTH domain
VIDLVIKLRELRHRAGLTQPELARKAGVGTKTISSFETGCRTDAIKLRQLERMVRAVGMTLEQFFSCDFEAAIVSESEKEATPSEFTRAELEALLHLMSVLSKFPADRIARMLRFISSNTQPSAVRRIRQEFDKAAAQRPSRELFS